MKKIYISGPITGDPGYRVKFDAVAQHIRDRGCIPINPADLPKGMTPKDYMAINLAALMQADGVVQLPGWEQSDGANIEWAVCLYCRIPVSESLEHLSKMMGYAAYWHAKGREWQPNGEEDVPHA